MQSTIIPCRPTRLRDVDVRAIVRAQIVPPLVHDTPSKVVEEMQICCGDARIDLAVINGKLHGFEIKSDADTLERLPRQVEAYGRVFDTMTIIAGIAHLPHVVEMIPRWWGVYSASGDSAGIKVACIRKPRKNPKVDPVSIAQLLWKPELLTLLESLGRSKGVKGKACRFLWEALAELCPLNVLKAEVRNALRARENWQPVARRT